MSKIIKISLLAGVISLMAITGITVLAQSPSDNSTATNAQDLEIKEPALLPDSPFYFLRNWQRKIQELLTFNSIKKAELKIKFASEKLLETKKMVEKMKSQKAIEKATNSYEKELDKIKETVDKIKYSSSTIPVIGKFLEKYNGQQILHQSILEKLEQQVPSTTMERIQEARQKHLERFNEVMEKLEEKIGAKNCPQFMPPSPGFCPDGKIVIKQGKNGCVMPPKCIAENSATSTDENDGYESTSTDSSWPKNCVCKIKKPGPVCGKNGQTYGNECKAKCSGIEIVSQGPCKNNATTTNSNSGCACAMQYEPVCGKNGKTYGNPCQSKCAGVETAYKGECSPKIIGGDKDKHGCLIAAGYSWCEAKKKCLRTWEEKCVATSTPRAIEIKEIEFEGESAN